MSMFHDAIRDILEDVQKFLLVTLYNERMPASTIEHKESILMKIRRLCKDYPQLLLTLLSEPSSPPPYIDMHGSSSGTSALQPASVYVYPDEEDKEYEVFSNASSEYSQQQDLPTKQSLDTTEGATGLLTLYQKRWVVISNATMYFYNKQTDKQPSSHITLPGWEVRVNPMSARDSIRRSSSFELVCPGKKTYQFMTANELETKKWLDAIQSVCSHHSGGSTGSFSDNSSQHGMDKSCSPNEPEDVYEVVEDGVAWAVPAIVRVDEESDDELYNVLWENEADEIDVDNPEDWYVGLWDCKVDSPHELNFNRGDLILIVSKDYDKDSWWVGEMNGKIGLVPRNYLMEAYELVDDSRRT